MIKQINSDLENNLLIKSYKSHLLTDDAALISMEIDGHKTHEQNFCINDDRTGFFYAGSVNCGVTFNESWRVFNYQFVNSKLLLSLFKVSPFLEKQ